LVPGYFPISFKNVTRERYNGYVIDYENGNKRIEEYTKSIVDDLNNNVLFTGLYDHSFIFRAFCKKYTEIVESHEKPLAKKILAYI